MTLNNIVIGVKNNDRIIWFVSRNGTVKKIHIISNMKDHNFVRNQVFKLEIFDLNKNKEYTEDWEERKIKNKVFGGSGLMYDHYYKTGHFFRNQTNAFEYLLIRINVDNTNLVKTAKQLIDKYPEYTF
ncbi:MAG: hypothetical protein U9Q83_09600 [Bacteroidota bacterium]|nr:hypothetical protein [Bacteroidota bacterium]